MKKLTNSLVAKVAAFLLFVVFVVAFGGSLVGMIILEEENVFTDGGITLHETFAGRYLRENCNYLAENYQSVYSLDESDKNYEVQKQEIEESILDHFNMKSGNFMFKISDGAGNVLFSNCNDEKNSYSYSRGYDYVYDKTGDNVYSENRTFYGYDSYDVMYEYLDKIYAEKNVVDISWQVQVKTYDDSGNETWTVIDQGDEYPYEMYAIEEYYDHDDDYYHQDLYYYGSDGEGHILDMADMEQVKIDCNISYTNIEEMKVFIEGYVPEETECVDSYNYAMEFADFISNARYAIIAAAVVSFMLCVVLFIFMICAAGHCNGYEGIHLYWTDKIPFDLFFAVLGGLSFLGLVLVDEITTDTGLFCGAIVVLYIIFVTSAVTGICVTFSARAKAGHWWHNTIIYKLLRLIKKVLCIVFKFVCYAISQLPMYWKVALGWLVLSILEFICIVTSWRTGELLLWWLLEKILLTVFIGLVVYAMNKLKKGGHTIASGDLDAKIDTKLLFLDFKQHAENLNSIGDGMSRAVDERMKSERMKTELITNVSHDIKTPLTSIVNYVDLIKKEDVQPEKVKEYIEVLDRQSARLKKLIEDLVEASKASTGNISVNMQPTDVSVLLEQAVGEYGQKLTNASLTPVLEFPEEPVMIMADGRHLWRVFDNLLGNICKYAMPNTRVYMSCAKVGDEAVVTFKNVSATQLNVPADELLERFTRGDASRHTEGSGLGLSIARSLMQLQNGKIDIIVDGDLFKVMLSFKLQ